MKCPKCSEEIFNVGITTSEVLHDEKIPEDVKDLIIPLLSRHKGLERGIAGNIELAYWRGLQKRLTTRKK